LARADRHDSPAPHDLAVLTTERVDTWSAMADAAQIVLVMKSDRDSVVAAAVPGAIEQILDNLLDNAIGMAPAGSTIAVTVEAGSTVHRLVVTDHGPGLSDEDKRKATRRFWRGDTSRPGTGLGLAIAASLARASGGSLALADAPGGGLAVMIDIPAWPATSDESSPEYHNDLAGCDPPVPERT
jgi:signal transduction histidine kinase